MGRMVLTVLGMVAEMELGFIRDRQRAGIDAAKAKGIYKGRPVTFERARIVDLRKEGMPQRYQLPLLLSPQPPSPHL
jgi:DNA invertase Pin-like site-specific DNA recombinase